MQLALCAILSTLIAVAALFWAVVPGYRWRHCEGLRRTCRSTSLSTDATAVMPGARLSDLEEASVSARVSRSGRATDALEDLETATQIVPTYAGGRIELVIGPAVSGGTAEAAE